MQVAKWGNSLAVRLPTAVVEALDLKEGDQIEITVETEDGTETTVVTVTGLKKVFCVAAGGGVLMAGGSPDLEGAKGAVAISFDQGVTWEDVASHDSPVTTMVANARL